MAERLILQMRPLVAKGDPWDDIGRLGHYSVVALVNQGRSGGKDGASWRCARSVNGLDEMGERDRSRALGKTRTMAVTKERDSLWQHDIELSCKPKPS